MPSAAIVGVQFGDEGKGKLVDILAQNADIVVRLVNFAVNIFFVNFLLKFNSKICRYAGGANAGHTIVHHGNKYKVNLLPSGILTESCINVIANGLILLFEDNFYGLSFFDRCGIAFTPIIQGIRNVGSKKHQLSRSPSYF